MTAESSPDIGALTIVGSGILFQGHMTPQARSHIERADKVFFAVGDPASARWIVELNSSAEPFADYVEGMPRRVVYEAWVDQMLTPLRAGQRVCGVFYGHPGLCVPPAHEAMRRAQREGIPVEMLPGLSAEDCLFADLGLDPHQHGWRSFEATDFLTRPRPVDTSSILVLRQIGVIGETTYQPESVNWRRGLRVLADVLAEQYGVDHDVVVYEAARLPVMRPIIISVPLRELPEARVTEVSTLLVPPKEPAPVDLSMLNRLEIPEEEGYPFFFDLPDEGRG